MPAVTPAIPSLKHHDFATLRRSRPGTVADTLPLALWIDTVGPHNEAFANYHNDFSSLYIVRQGRGTHLIDGIEYAVARGDVYVMAPGQAHWFRNCDRLRTDTLHFTSDIFTPSEEATLKSLPGFDSLWVPSSPVPRTSHHSGRRWLHLTPSAYREVSQQITDLRTEWERNSPDGALMARVLFLRLLIHLARCQVEGNAATTPPVSDTVPEYSHEATVAAAVRYLDAHFYQPLRIESVAAQVCLSPDRFTEVFTQAMGRTPRDYLRHLRLEQARTLLQSTDLSVAEVARRSGFGDAAYLGRVLRRSMGQTPSALRRAR